MSRAQDALAKGFDTLTDWAADTVSYRNASIPAVINRTPPPPEDPELMINFASRGLTHIEIRFSDMPSGGAPRAGEFISENSGAIRHKISKVFPRPDSFLLFCTVTQ